MAGTTTTAAPRVYSGPAVTESGCLATSIPFLLHAVPAELRVQADRRTGLFSGGFEVGLGVRPGPARSRNSAVTELVTLFASGDRVRFASQLVKGVGSYLATLAAVPGRWDLRTGSVYDLVSEIVIANGTPRDQTVYLSSNLIPLDGISQTVALLSQDVVTVLSGKRKSVLLALAVTASVATREDVTVSAMTGEGASLDPVKVIVNTDPTAPAIAPYRVAGPASYTWAAGSTVDVTLTTADGAAGTPTWGTSELKFLADHRIRFSPSGILVSDPQVRGPAESRSVVFWVRNELNGGGHGYAAKIVQVVIS